MLAPTHSAFGIFLTLTILAVFGIQWSLHWTIIVCAILGSILPDIDHPKSVIGRLLRFISVPIESRFEHRTITHSIIGWAVASTAFALIILVLVIINHFLVGIWDFGFGISSLAPRWLAAFSIGYISHLILDMFNRRGSQMFWPDKGRDVIPKNPKLRPESGSKVEIIIFGVLMLMIILALPLSKYGLKSSLRWLLATPGSAIEEFKNYNNHAYLEFEGVFTQTQSPVKGEGEILGVDNQRLIILYNKNVYTIGEEFSSDIIAENVRVKRTAIPIVTRRIVFQNKTHDQLLQKLRPNVLISGIVHLPTDVNLVMNPQYSKLLGLDRATARKMPEPTIKVIEQKGSDLILRFASLEQIKNLSLDGAYSLQCRKDSAELFALQVEAAKAYARIQELEAGDGLTELGRAALLSEEKRQANQRELADLNSTLAGLHVKIDEVELRIKNHALVYSGEVYLRR